MAVGGRLRPGNDAAGCGSSVKNRLETDFSAAVRLIASPIRVAIGSTRMLGEVCDRLGRLDRIGDHQLFEIGIVDARDGAA